MSSLAYMLDTNVLIDLLRGTSMPIKERFRAAADRIAVSTISVMELEYGIERSSDPILNRKQSESLLSLVDILAFDSSAAQNAGRLRAHMSNSGLTIGPFDTLIAGHARSEGLIIITNNVREFSRVPGLEIENWLHP